MINTNNNRLFNKDFRRRIAFFCALLMTMNLITNTAPPLVSVADINSDSDYNVSEENEDNSGNGSESTDNVDEANDNPGDAGNKSDDEVEAEENNSSTENESEDKTENTISQDGEAVAPEDEAAENEIETTETEESTGSSAANTEVTVQEPGTITEIAEVTGNNVEDAAAAVVETKKEPGPDRYGIEFTEESDNGMTVTVKLKDELTDDKEVVFDELVISDDDDDAEDAISKIRYDILNKLFSKNLKTDKDKDTFETSFYRLKVVDEDGKELKKENLNGVIEITSETGCEIAAAAASTAKNKKSDIKKTGEADGTYKFSLNTKGELIFGVAYCGKVLETWSRDGASIKLGVPVYDKENDKADKKLVKIADEEKDTDEAEVPWLIREGTYRLTDAEEVATASELERTSESETSAEPEASSESDQPSDSELSSESESSSEPDLSSESESASESESSSEPDLSSESDSSETESGPYSESPYEDETEGIMWFKVSDNLDKKYWVLINEEEVEFGSNDCVRIETKDSFDIVFDTGLRETECSNGIVDIKGLLPVGHHVDYMDETDTVDAGLFDMQENTDDSNDGYIRQEFLDISVLTAFTILDVDESESDSELNAESESGLFAEIDSESVFGTDSEFNPDSELKSEFDSESGSVSYPAIDAESGSGSSKDISDSDHSFSIELSDEYTKDAVDIYRLDGESLEKIRISGDDIVYADDLSIGTYVVTSKTKKVRYICSDDESYEITITYDESSGIPDDAVPSIKELNERDSEYKDYIDKATEAFESKKSIKNTSRVYYIALVDPETDTEYVPDESIEIDIRLSGKRRGSSCTDLNVVYFTADEENDMVIPGMSGDTDSDSAEFMAETLPVYAVVRYMRHQILTATDGKSYEITVEYDSNSGIPEDAVLEVTELTETDPNYDEYVSQANEILGKDERKLLFARPFDIKLVDPDNGEKYEPDENVKVSMKLLTEEVEKAEELSVVHFKDTRKERRSRDARKSQDQTENKETISGEIVESEIVDGSVEFETGSFSVFVIVQTVLRQKLTASDGNEYLVTVTYDNVSGIPSDAELVVTELKEGDEGYAEYVAAAAEKIGENPDHLAFARPFDITLKNPETGEEYQPNKDVTVTIQLLGEDLNEYVNIDVIHFPGEADGEAEIMDSNINGEFVEFETDGFSVYVLTGVQDTLRTYYFYSYNEYGDYASFFFYTDQNTMTDHLTIKNGEKLFAPHDPTHPTDPRAVFIGWFEGTATDNNTIEFSEKPFDFSKEQKINKEDGNTALTVHLYAKFSNVARVNFHGQYDADTGSYPIVETFMGTLEEGQTSISVPVDNYKAGYYSTVDGAFPKYKFYGWSADPIEVPGEGQTYKVSSPMDVVGSIDLYPIYDEIRWLSYNSGNAGTGATYFAPVSFTSGDGLAEEDIKIPTRQGYTFTGWYLSVESQGTDAQNGTGLQLTDSVGKFADHAPSELSPYGISITTDQETGKKRLYLSGNREIYAGWDIGTADYKIVVWKERNVNSENYDWAENFTLQAQPGDVVTVVTPGGAAVTTGTLAPYEALNANDSYNAVHTDQLGEGDANPYANYLFDGAKTLNDTTYDRDADAYTGTKTVAYDNTTVVNLYYSRTSGAAGMGNYTLKFDFLDAADGVDVTYTVAAGGSFVTTLGEAITLPTAADMNARPGYEFVWYADESCTARVFFDQESFDSYTDGAKVLYTTMPDHDLTVYGNWEKRWYLIQIDPNYGALYAYNDAEPPVLTGNGSTYFFKSYQGDYIQEYTWVTRDYVASESGNFYYVNHDYDYVRKHGGDRYTYYTKNLEEATEYTTYKYKKGAYLYDGWYQVNDDGTETPYNFGQPITGNTKLRLHWKLAGTYYLEYNADVTVDGKRLIGSVGGGITLLDPNPYRDQASITLDQTAKAPEGYTFVGWRVRGDDTGTIYYSELCI